MQPVGAHLAFMRRRAPLVQNITNFVAMNIAANVMLAAGASPAMAHAAEEAEAFAALAASLTVNLGTADAHWIGGMDAAAAAMLRVGKPWVLDPVAVGASEFRATTAARLIAHRPAVIRGNASEVLALSGARGTGKGADAADRVEDAEEAARALARRCGAVVAVTGPVDFVTDGTRAARVGNGHPMMPRVTALGCALTCLIGAFVVGQDPFEATTAAIAYYGIAGEAAGGAAGPASFQTAFVDALHALTPEDVSQRAKVHAA